MTVWARVRDKSTGHQFDVGLERLQQLLDAGAVEEVTSGPNGGRHAGKPRPPKPRRPLGTPAPQSTKRAAKAVAEPKETESS